MDKADTAIRRIIAAAHARMPANKRLGELAVQIDCALLRVASDCFGRQVDTQMLARSSMARSVEFAALEKQFGAAWCFIDHARQARCLIAFDLRCLRFAADAVLNGGLSISDDAAPNDDATTEMEARLAKVFGADIVDAVINTISDKGTERKEIPNEFVATRVAEEDANKLLSEKPFIAVTIGLVSEEEILGVVSINLDASMFDDASTKAPHDFDERWRKNLRLAVMRSPLRLNAVLAHRRFGYCQLARLKEGHILELDGASLTEVIIEGMNGGAPIGSAALVSSEGQRALTSIVAMFD